MPITPDRIARLRDFGLSEYAARVYLALLDLGETDARAISTLSKVPTSKIYQTLEQLHDRGLVSIIPETPKRYAPVPFEEYLDRVHQSHMEAAKRIETDREDLKRIFNVIGTVEMEGTGGFAVFRGRRNSLEKVAEQLRRTESDWLAIEPPGFAERYGALLPEITAARDRGVNVRILTTLTAETLPALEALAELVELRDRRIDPGTAGGNVAILLSDSRRALVITFNPDDGSAYVGKDVGIATDQDGIVHALEAIFTAQWNPAPTYEARRGEILEGRQAEFTRFYTNQGELLRAIRPYLQEGVAGFDYINALPAAAPSPTGHSLLEAIAAGPNRGRHRLLLNIPDLDTATAYAGIARRVPNLEIRHLDTMTFTRFIVIDRRESLFSTAAPSHIASWEEVDPDAVEDLVIHTNNPSTVASLHAHFEALWERAVTLADREHELAAFPHVQPRELGLGRLFDRVQDAVLVTDPQGLVTLANPVAEQVFSRSAASLLDAEASALFDPPSALAFDRALRRALAETLEGDDDATGSRFDAAILTPDGRRIETEVSLSLLPAAAPDGEPLVLALVRDVTAQRQAEEAARRIGAAEAANAAATAAASRNAFVADVSGALATALTPEAVLSVVSRYAVPTLGDLCAIYLVAPEGAVRQAMVAARTPAQEAATRALWDRYSWPPTHPDSILGVIRSGRRVVLDGLDEAYLEANAKNAEELRLLREQAPGSLLILPLIARGNSIGALTLLRSRESPTYMQQDLALIEAFASRVALTLDTVQLLQAEQEARALAERAAERMRLLFSLTEALARATTPAQLAEVAVGHAMKALGARSASLYETTEPDGDLLLVDAAGFPPDIVERYRRIPIAAEVPLTVAVRSGIPQFFESVTAFEAAFPHMQGVLARTGNGSNASFPLELDGVVLGAIGLSFKEPRTFSAEDRDLMLALARQCAQALDRLRLLDAERAARERSEALLRTLSNLGEGMLLTDGLRIVDANAACCDLIGYNREEILSFQNGLAVVAPEARAAVEDHRAHRLANPDGGPQRHLTTFVHKDGTRIPVELAIGPLAPAHPDRCLILVRGADPEMRRVPVEGTARPREVAHRAAPPDVNR